MGTLEAEIADLRGQLQFSQDESASRKCCIEERDECLAEADRRKADEKGVYEGKLKEMNDCKDAEIKELQDEIDKLREKCKDSQEKVKVLADIRKTLEAEIADLRGQLQFSQDESAGRKKCCEERDETLAVAAKRKKNENKFFKKKKKKKKKK